VLDGLERAPADKRAELARRLHHDPWPSIRHRAEVLLRARAAT
jgi:hypothetical protein